MKTREIATSDQTTFFMRFPRPGGPYHNKETIKIVILTHYHFSLIACCIEAANGKVIDGAFFTTKNTSNFQNSPFTRDFCVILKDKKIILIPSDYLSDDSSEEVLLEISKRYQLNLVAVKKAYFQGGNVIYVPEKNLLLHGFILNGRYDYSIDPGIDITSTNDKLTDVLKPYGVKLLSVVVSEEVLSRMRTKYHYHLDLFMHLLTDGRLIILNKKMLSSESCKKLEDIFGDNFIDLNYEDYLSSPCVMNLLGVSSRLGTKYISTPLPEKVLAALKKHSVDVITAEMLDSRSALFDSGFAAKVSFCLTQNGFLNVDSKKLLQVIPKNRNPFYYEDGKPLPSSFYETYISRCPENSFTFEYYLGGPHCLTLEVETYRSKSVEKKEEPSPMTSASLLKKPAAATIKLLPEFSFLAAKRPVTQGGKTSELTYKNP